MSNVYNGNTGVAEQSCWPAVILLGTSFQFSDQLMKLLTMDFDGIRFQRLGSLEQLSDFGIAPRVAIIHEAFEDPEAAVQTLRHRWPQTLIAIGCHDPAILDRLNTSGSGSPVSALKMDAQVDVWFAILRLLLSGHPYVPVSLPPSADAVETPIATESAPADPLPPGGLARLTPREMEILPLIAQGQQNKIIAGRLGLSIHTVKLHSHNIFNQLGVSNRTGAANWYLSQIRGGSNVTAQSKF